MIGDEYEKWITIADQGTERKCYQKTCKPKDCYKENQVAYGLLNAIYGLKHQ